MSQVRLTVEKAFIRIATRYQRPSLQSETDQP
jgi:hypothetical protein